MFCLFASVVELFAGGVISRKQLACDLKLFAGGVISRKRLAWVLLVLGWGETDLFINLAGCLEYDTYLLVVLPVV